MKAATPRLTDLRAQRLTLLEYLKMKLDADDMHAVQDAASDIRELDAQIAILRSLAHA